MFNMLSGLSKTLHRVAQRGRSGSAAGCGQAGQGGWQRERHKRQRYPRALAGCLGGDSRRNRDRFAASVSPFIFYCTHFLQNIHEKFHISRDSTYGIHTESVHTLLILLSTPLFSGKPAFQMKAYETLMRSDRSIALTRTLLLYFADQGEAPAAYLNEV